MRHKVLFSCLLLAAMAVALTLRSAAAIDPEEWPPIGPEEWKITECPQHVGAPAIYLLREDVSDFEQNETRIFRRLKILTPAGRDRANIEIPYFKGSRVVRNLEARVIPGTGGAPRIFGGKVFEKTAFRARGIRMMIKAFALPDVDVGDIIDYRYKLVSDSDGSSQGADDFLDALQISGGKPMEGPLGKGMKLLSFPAETWDVQEDLYTRKAKFVYVPSEFMGDLMEMLLDGPASLMWFTQRMPRVQPVKKTGRLEIEMENIPPFEPEELMPPEDSERMTINLLYFVSKLKTDEMYWKAERENWSKAVARYIGNTRKLAPEALKLAEGIDDPVAKLERLYERAQGIRNLSYEKNLTTRRRKAEKIKDNEKASDVLERNYGFRIDITRAFIALAQAAGFEAEAVRVATRDDKIFSSKLLSFYEQLDSEAALVKLVDKEILFDPATPFCPFGLVHWSRSNTAAVRFSDKPPGFFTTSVYPPELGLTQREVVFGLDPQGNLAGTMKTTYTGHEALVRRLEHIHDDQADIRKSMEEELAGLLPMGAAVTMKRLDGIDDNTPALIVEYDVTIPGFATSAGDRMILPASPLLGTQRYPFRHAERKYPVYFPFPFREFNDIIITLPEGMTVETRPAPQNQQQDFSSYSLVCVQEGPQKVHVQRDLVIKKSYFPVSEYAALKTFYDTVRASDEEQLVLGREKKPAASR